MKSLNRDIYGKIHATSSIIRNKVWSKNPYSTPRDEADNQISDMICNEIFFINKFSRS